MPRAKSHNSNSIIDFVREQANRPMKIRDLSKALHIPPNEYTAFRREVKDLLAEGKLVTLKGGRIGLPDQLNVLIGKVTITKGGTGFLIIEGAPKGDKEDVMIPSEYLSTALDGDKVMVRREGQWRGREVGSIVRILERARRRLVGVFHRTPHFNIVTPDDRRIHRDIYIPDGETLSANKGDKVVVELESWDDPYVNPEGKVIEVLGRPGDPLVDLLAIQRAFDLDETFPSEIEGQAEEAGKWMTPEEVESREDFRDVTVYTIDPSDAKDHDDAIHVERTSDGYRLGVHIADVSFFVREGSLLDQEAYARGNSVYLPGKVIPMLPEGLSNDMCSLKDNVDRLTQTVIIDFDSDGNPTSWRHSKSVINSRASLSYEQVQAIFNDDSDDDEALKLRDDLLLARELSRKMHQRRFEQGSLDFDLPEPRIELNDSGEVVSLSTRVRLESHRLIEEFMLAANKAVALTVSRLSMPMLYRVHDQPDLEKLVAFAELAEACGHAFTVSDTVTPKMVQAFLESIKDTPEEEYLSELALRAMKKAVYQPTNIGHFGLAFKHYTHFTSPIRRYPDLMVHRMLSKLKNGRYPHEYTVELKKTLQQIGDHCSETERAAEKAEREAVKMLQASFLAKHLGMEFDGVISGAVARGFFVRLVGLNAEGMVKVSDIDDDFYQLHEDIHAMIGKRTGRTFRLGDKVRVSVVAVDVELREVDLHLIDHTPGRAARIRVKPKGKSSAPSKKDKDIKTANAGKYKQKVGGKPGKGFKPPKKKSGKRKGRR